MNTRRGDEVALERTVEFQPRDLETERPAIALLSPSAGTSTGDLRSLLHRRLRSLSLLFALLYATAIVFIVLVVPATSWRLTDPKLAGALDRWGYAAALLLTGVLAVVVWTRPSLSLRQLRVIEFILIATLALRLSLRAYSALWAQYDLGDTLAYYQAGEEAIALGRLSAAAYNTNLFAVICMVAYAVFIPNTWRRCVLVVGLLWLIPLAALAVGCAVFSLPAPLWFPIGVQGAYILLTFAAAMAVVGSHRIETLRAEALQARRFGQYVLRRPLGSGGMGEVYLADHVLLRRPCALKLIRPERAGDPATLQRFEREVQATATLTHPNAVQIFDYGHTQDGTFYYVMEYLPGMSLEAMVKQAGPLPAGRVVHFLRQLCGALHEAHAIGLIHRDIKPGNVMICQRGSIPDVAKLLDFGLVQAAAAEPGDSRLTREGVVVGTPAYMSPEQASGQLTVDARSDIYSLGCLGYFLLTGHPPFAGPSAVKVLAAHLYEAPPPLAHGLAVIPPDLEQVILKCLAKDPTDRFPSARSLDLALAGCAAVSLWSEDEAIVWWQLHSATNGKVDATGAMSDRVPE